MNQNYSSLFTKKMSKIIKVTTNIKTKFNFLPLSTFKKAVIFTLELLLNF